MHQRNRKAPGQFSVSRWLRQIPWLLIPVLALSFTIAHAQQLTGTISGIVADQTGARIAGANILITNDASGDKRESKADTDGFFSVTALPPGTYTVTVSAKSFASWKETGILVNQGDSRTIPNIRLKVSSDVTAITVVSGADAEVPVDTAEVSATLNNELVDSAILTGRNAAELIKMMPGVVFNNAGGAGSSYSSTTTSTNNGPAGSFSANGTQPYGSTAVILDGANLLDPGNAGTQVANINQDMTDSVKFLSASYGAEYAKGPAVLQAFSKSGGQKFHGEAYLYARNTSAGYANDWFLKQTQEHSEAAKTGSTPESIKAANQVYPEHFYYIGGNVGGPVYFKGFNKNRDKLFFWGGYEKMYQTPYSSPQLMNVPTADQMSGDFNNVGVDSHVISTWSSVYTTPCNTDDGWQGCNIATSPWGLHAAGAVPNLKNYFDPTGVIFSELTVPGSTNNPGMANQKYVKPNQYNGWNNMQYSPTLPVNRWEATGKVTYAFNDNNKVWGSYAYQTETDQHPLNAWWSPEWTVPYPSQPTAKETANLYLVNFTHVFSASTTNEFVFAYAKFENDFAENQAAASRSKVGFPIESLFRTSGAVDQIPNSTGGWNSGLTEINHEDFNSGIYGKNSFGKTSKSPAITDNFTKIIKTHSLKGGFYWDTQENLQANGSDMNGNYDFETWGATSTYNLTLDRLMGRIQHYDEQNTDVIPDITQHEWSIWAQDSWKATPKLTLNLGLRADHEGQWYDKIGGVQVWDQATYDNSATPGPNTGLLWHNIDSKIPTSGWKSQLFFYNPRLGVAFDVFGTGKTVVRGGFGSYRYQVSSNDASGAMGGPLGSYDFNTQNGGANGFYGYGIQSGSVCSGISYATVTTGQGSCTGHTQLKVPSGLNQNGSSGLKADKEGDQRVPYADTWSFGVAQALPGHAVAEVSYVGSASRNQLLNGANGHIDDINAIPYAAFFEPDPRNFLYQNLASTITGFTSVSQDDWRPMRNYTSIFLQTHGGFANYHSLQASAQKQSGNLYLFTNFTFGKVLGTRDGSTSNGNGNGSVVNPYDLSSNYGQLEYDHTKVFNVSFSYKLPKPIHNNWALGEAVNGWQVSGYTTYQDGIPYQASSQNMNMNYHQFEDQNGNIVKAQEVLITLPIPATANGGNTTYGVGDVQWLGSAEYESGLQPVLTCDPRKGKASGAYFNPKCFAAPLAPTATSMGENGQTVWPYIRTPHYWGSDLAIFKAFKVTEAQRFEVRISATNWLNHPSGQFGIAGTSDNQLTFNGVSTAAGRIVNTNDSTTGKPLNKYGYRWIQFAGKYYF